jgi:RNA polymerase sigma-70 factor (ECF subfamily)
VNASAIGSTDSSLIRCLRAGDPGAWEKFVDLYAPWVYGWTRRLGLSAQDGADVTQETLLAVHRSIEQYRARGPENSFRGWLWTIIRNKIRDLHRAAAPDAGSGGTDALQRMHDLPEQLPEEDEAGPEFGGLLRRALEQVRAEFEPRTWQAFWDVVIEGRTTANVAADLGISQNAVRQARSRILRRLRLQLGDDQDG